MDQDRLDEEMGMKRDVASMGSLSKFASPDKDPKVFPKTVRLTKYIFDYLEDRSKALNISFNQLAFSILEEAVKKEEREITNNTLQMSLVKKERTFSTTLDPSEATDLESAAKISNPSEATDLESAAKISNPSETVKSTSLKTRRRPPPSKN